MSQQTEGIGIALEVGEVVPEDGTHLALKVGTSALEEIGLHGLFATMTKGRIAQIVSQAGCRHDLSDFLEHGVLQFRVLQRQLLGHIATQRHAHAGHL